MEAKIKMKQIDAALLQKMLIGGAKRLEANKEYINEMIDLIEKHGSYIVVEEGLALPHAGISESVFMTGISLLIVKEGVLFPNNKRVNIFLSFATINRNDHVKILNDLFELITKYNFIEDIINVDSYDELQKYFKNISYRKESYVK